LDPHAGDKEDSTREPLKVPYAYEDALNERVPRFAARNFRRRARAPSVEKAGPALLDFFR
jgi:hypothetical protein